MLLFGPMEEGPRAPFVALVTLIEQPKSLELSRRLDVTSFKIKNHIASVWKASRRFPEGVLHRHMYALSIGHEYRGVEQTKLLSPYFNYPEAPDRKL